MRREEYFNSVSHLAGAVLAVAGTVVLIVLASLADDPWRIVSFSVYGVTLALLYLFSGIYHGSSGRRLKAVFQRLDHVAIYLLIAGTYTPFVLGPLRGGWGWTLFGVLWGLAVLGTVQEFIPQRTRRISLLLYLTMGWLVLIAWGPLVAVLAPNTIRWLIIGGSCYSVGIIFFMNDERWPYGHQIWHAFVLAGSIAQYVAVFSIALMPLNTSIHHSVSASQIGRRGVRSH